MQRGAGRHGGEPRAELRARAVVGDYGWIRDEELRAEKLKNLLHELRCPMDPRDGASHRLGVERLEGLDGAADLRGARAREVEIGRVLGERRRAPAFEATDVRLESDRVQGERGP